MKNIMRWIAVLPGTILAAILCQVLFGLLLLITPALMHWPVEFVNNWALGFSLVFSAAFIAPSSKVTVAVIVALFHTLGVISMVAHVVTANAYSPMWWFLVRNVGQVMATIVACGTVYALHKENKPKAALN